MRSSDVRRAASGESVVMRSLRLQHYTGEHFSQDMGVLSQPDPEQ
jgi:hypothetical protein